MIISILHCVLGGVHTVLDNGQFYKVAAEVGLLTRNIKIIGGGYALQETEAFGARFLNGLKTIVGQDGSVSATRGSLIVKLHSELNIILS